MKTKLSEFKKLLLLIFLTVGLFSTDVYAHFGSKGPFGGSVSCGTVYDTTVYFGTTEGGVFESTRISLIGWRARPVGLKSGKITALVHTSSYLFAGTADSGMFIFNGYVGTADRYWNKVNNGLSNLKIKALVAIDTITVLAGTEGGGIFKTTNKGATWVHINNASLNTAVITAFVKAGNRIIAASQNGGVFVSDDKGATWSDFNDVNTLTINGTNTLSYNATTDELLVLNNNGLFKASSVAAIGTPSFASISIPSVVVHSISNNGTHWFLATNAGVYSTLTAAISWTANNAGLTGDALNVAVVVPFQTNLVAGTVKEGIFKTPAAAIQWVANNANFNNAVTYSMICKDVLLVVAATDRGVMVSKDLAASYKRSNTGLKDSLNVTDLVFSGTNLFATTKNEGVFASADTGKTWTAYNLGLTNLHLKKIVASGTHLYTICSNGTVYQSTGMGWVSIQTGLPSGVEPSSFAFYNGTILLGTLGDGVFTRAEASGSWTAANNGLNNLDVTSVTTNGNKLFAGTNGSGVFVSDIATILWSAAAATAIPHTSMVGLNGSKIQAMAYYQGYVYASYKGGLLASSDNGVTWIAGGNQFNLPSFTDVNKISFVTTRVFVTTENNALYSNGLSELPVVSGVLDERTILPSTALSLSPNPAKGDFRVVLENTAKSDFSEMIIFNAFGAVMDRFETYQENISVHYPQGIYFVQVNTSKGSVTQKMIIE